MCGDQERAYMLDNSRIGLRTRLHMHYIYSYHQSRQTDREMENGIDITSVVLTYAS